MLTIDAEDLLLTLPEETKLDTSHFKIDLTKPFGEVKRTLAANILMQRTLPYCDW